MIIIIIIIIITIIIIIIIRINCTFYISFLCRKHLMDRKKF